MKAVEAHQLSIKRTASLPDAAKAEYDQIISAVRKAVEEEAAMDMFWDRPISTLVRTRLIRDGYQVIESTICDIPMRKIRWEVI